MAFAVIEWRGRSSAAFEPPDTRLTDPGDAGVVTGLPTVSTPLIGQGGYLFLNHDAQVRTAIGRFIELVMPRGGRRVESSIRISVFHEG
jgi:hypothetical protein